MGCCCFRGTTTAVTLEPKNSHHTLSFTHHTRTYAHTRAHQSSRYITLAWYNIFDCRRHWQLLLIFAQYKAASLPLLPATCRGIVGQLLDLPSHIPCGACGTGVMGTNCITLHINSALRHALSPTHSSPVSSVFLAILVYLCLKKFQLLLRNGTWNDVGAPIAAHSGAELKRFCFVNKEWQFHYVRYPLCGLCSCCKSSKWFYTLVDYGIFCLLTKLGVLRIYNLFQVVFRFKWYLNTVYRAPYILSFPHWLRKGCI